MLHPIFVFVAVWIARLTVAQDAPNQLVVPSNTSDYTPTAMNATQQLVLSYSVMGGFNYSNIHALTGNANDIPQHRPNSGLVLTNSSSVGDLSNKDVIGQSNPIALINCDPGANNDSNIDTTSLIQSAVDVNAAGVLFYSFTANFCNLSSNISHGFQDYGLFYTMTNINDSKLLEQNALDYPKTTPGQGALAGEIETLATYQNDQSNHSGGNGFGDPTPGTAVAMIILYSITGVIALLFVIIIVTGAIRAHRHPERYGPRNIGGGRVRQTRAQGIGRALLETLPLVKFGEPQPSKPTDVELAPTHTNASSSAPAMSTEHVRSTATDGTAADSDTMRTVTAPDAAAVAISPDATHTEKSEKSLECAICWEDFSKGEQVRMLPCEHKFHPKCIDPWLLDFSGTCPVCRIDFGPKKDKKKEGESNAGESSARPINWTGAGASSSGGVAGSS